ncbi:MAG TPA: 4a-hydroxytetrahydrobiopterin dehydratase [Bacillales bacterium]|nr:4a-hydroxytetrahydrobiopterin dehydratase [Bacillales bacterium]
MAMSEAEIQEHLKKVSGWEVVDGKLWKAFKLKDFKASLAFVNNVGELAEKANHHPDILIQYNRVTLSLMTHDEDGITEKDFKLASEIEK